MNPCQVPTNETLAARREVAAMLRLQAERTRDLNRPGVPQAFIEKHDIEARILDHAAKVCEHPSLDWNTTTMDEMERFVCGEPVATSQPCQAPAGLKWGARIDKLESVCAERDEARAERDRTRRVNAELRAKLADAIGSLDKIRATLTAGYVAKPAVLHHRSEAASTNELATAIEAAHTDEMVAVKANTDFERFDANQRAGAA